MDNIWIVPVLALVTLGLIVVLAMRSKRRTEARKADPHAPKSTLAKDGAHGGVAFLTTDAIPEMGLRPVPHRAFGQTAARTAAASDWPVSQPGTGQGARDWPVSAAAAWDKGVTQR